MGADAILTLLVVAVLGGIVVLANYADQTQRSGLRQSVIVALAVMNALIVFLGLSQVGSAYMPEPTDETPDKAAAWGALVASLVFAGLSTAILFPKVRRALTVIFPRFRAQKQVIEQPPMGVEEAHLPLETSGTPLFPQMLDYYTTESRPPILSPNVIFDTGFLPEESPQSISIRGFNPQSMVHTVALAFALYYLGSQLIGFIIGGGLSGVAENFEGGLSAWDLILNGLPQIVLPLLGVGIGLRRNLPETLNRLGLYRPTIQGVGVAVGVTVALFVFLLMASVAWTSLVSEETYDEQTEASEALSKSIDTVGLAFLLAAMAAIGEEIAFRGALQPVFGLWPTAILFMLVHLQYTLTPASLIILVVAIAFGWIRHNYGTTVAILTHFLYNFIPLVLTLGFSEEAFGWIRNLL